MAAWWSPRPTEKSSSTHRRLDLIDWLLCVVMCAFVRYKLAKACPADLGGCRRPTATMVPHSQHRCIRQSANMLGCLFLFDRNLFWGLKNRKKQDSWGFLFFPVFSGGFFHRNVVLEGVAGIPVFCHCPKIFLQEYLRDRNSCIYSGFLWIPLDSSGFLRIPPDSSGFLFPPNAVLLWPATKVGFLLRKYQPK